LTKIEAIESQVKGLTPEELTQFREWFAQFDGELWDRQFESDAQAGKLDRAAHRAMQDHRAGKSTEL